MTKKFRKAKNLVKSAKDSWVDKKVKIEDCISNLSEAITIMHKGILPSFGGDNALLHQHLLAAYCLRALFEQTATPKSERIAEDLKDALSLWPNDVPTIMFYNIIDLLQMKGSMEDVYSFINMSFNQ
ncbi:separase [Trifolium repens]|nr:separase [Trifolium repens]